MPGFSTIRLSSERLIIRWLHEDDAAAIFDIQSHPEVMRYWSSPPMTSIADAVKIIASSQAGYQSGEFLQLGIERTTDLALIGTCTLFHYSPVCRRAEIGYALGRSYWGKGYMQEALKRLIDYAFDELYLNRLEADVDPRNVASANVLKRLGFVMEGHLRERWIVSGEVSDSHIYGLLHRDWQ